MHVFTFILFYFFYSYNYLAIQKVHFLENCSMLEIIITSIIHIHRNRTELTTLTTTCTIFFRFIIPSFVCNGNPNINNIAYCSSFILFLQLIHANYLPLYTQMCLSLISLDICIPKNGYIDLLIQGVGNLSH